jgi:hypothetical protein
VRRVRVGLGHASGNHALSQCARHESNARPLPRRRRAGHVLCVAVTALLMSGGAAVARSGGLTGHHGERRIATTVLQVPSSTDPSEPHLAVDPSDPDHLYAVAQVQIPNLLTQEVLWRTDDGGGTWERSPLLGGMDNTSTPSGFSVDPVVAAGRNGLVLFGAFTLDADEAAQTAVLRIGSRVSTDHGARFTAFGSADRVTLPLCVFVTGCPPPPDAQGLDKPWLAVDATHGRFGGSAYLVWVHDYADGRHQLRFSVSRDRGRSYSAPIVLDRSTAKKLDGLEELAQLTVAPDGSVDVVWNAVRHGRPVIVQARSRNGGTNFSRPKPIVWLRRNASRSGIVTTLAVSRRGRMGLCWSQARSPDRYDPIVQCKITDRHGSWGGAHRLLPGNRGREYLPAAAFQGERLRVAAYDSDARWTRLVAAGAARHGFAGNITLNRWPVPASRICGPRVPQCRDDETFIGDYIGLVATRRRVVVDYIAPSPDASRQNRVVVSSLTSGGAG